MNGCARVRLTQRIKSVPWDQADRFIMGNAEPDDQPLFEKRQWFVTTSWTNLLATQQSDPSQAREALETLCTTYWYPLYAYVRRKGYSAEDAEDMTQAFFFKVIEKNYLGAVDRKKGKFRSFLLASLNHFLSNERNFRNAEKRGGRRTFISLDDQSPEQRYQLEPVSELTPQKMFEFRWAETLIDRVYAHLRAECAAAGKEALFDAVKPYCAEDPASGAYNQVAEKVGMSAGAVAVAVHRLRQRYAELVREEVTRTVASPGEVQGELNHLLEILREMNR